VNIGVAKARARLSELLKRAGGGEEIIITRRGQPIARLSLVAATPRRSAIKQLFEENARIRCSLPAIGLMELNQDRDAGRR
jgi:prevent-host-death family protein